MFGPFGGFERREDPPQFPYPPGVDILCPAAGPVVPKPLVPDAPDRDGSLRVRGILVERCLTDIPSGNVVPRRPPE